MTKLIEEMYQFGKGENQVHNWNQKALKHLYKRYIIEEDVKEAISKLKNITNITGYQNENGEPFTFKDKKDELRYLMNVHHGISFYGDIYETTLGKPIHEYNVHYLQLVSDQEYDNPTMKYKSFIGTTGYGNQPSSNIPNVIQNDYINGVYIGTEEKMMASYYKHELLKTMVSPLFNGVDDMFYNLDGKNISLPIKNDINLHINSPFTPNDNKALLLFVEEHLNSNLEYLGVKPFPKELIKETQLDSNSIKIIEQNYNDTILFLKGAKVSITYPHPLTQEPITVDAIVVEDGVLSNKPLLSTNKIGQGITIDYPRIYKVNFSTYTKENQEKIYSIDKINFDIQHQKLLPSDIDVKYQEPKREPIRKGVMSEVEFTSREVKQEFLKRCAIDAIPFDTLGQKLTINMNNGVYSLTNNKKQEVLLTEKELEQFKLKSPETQEHTHEDISKK